MTTALRLWRLALPCLPAAQTPLTACDTGTDEAPCLESEERICNSSDGCVCGPRCYSPSACGGQRCAVFAEERPYGICVPDWFGSTGNQGGGGGSGNPSNPPPSQPGTNCTNATSCVRAEIRQSDMCEEGAVARLTNNCSIVVQCRYCFVHPDGTEEGCALQLGLSPGEQAGAYEGLWACQIPLGSHVAYKCAQNNDEYACVDW